MTGVGDGQWHHLAFVRTGADFALYVDGYQAMVAHNPTIGTAAIAAAYAFLGGANTTDPAHAGAPDAYPFGGRIDDLAVYRRGLTAAEVLVLTRFGSGRKVASLGNGQFYAAVQVYGSGNVIGGGAVGSRNVISGQDRGVDLQGSGNRVQGNYLGTTLDGNRPLSGTVVSFGGGYGVQLAGTGNTVGTDADGSADATEGNVIGDFGFAGVYQTGGDNTIAGNSVGVGADGVSDVPNTYQGNGGAGIYISGTGSGTTLVGGTAPYTRNVVSGNRRGGIRLEGFNGNHPSGVVIRGNTIGLLADGVTARGNGGFTGSLDAAVSLLGASTGTQILDNVIAGNPYMPGVGVVGPAASGTVIRGNRIGTTADGTQARPNDTGVLVAGGPAGTVIGGPQEADGNLISGNTGDGVTVTFQDAQIIQTWLRADGNLADSSLYGGGQGPILSTVGNVGYTAGRFGQAFAFAGNGAVEAAVSGVFGASNPGSSFWFKAAAPAAGSVVLAFHAAAAPGFAYQYRLQSDGHLILEASNGTVLVPTVVSAANLLDGRWHFVAGSLTSELQLFVDGVSTGPGVPLPGALGLDKLVIGGGFVGAVDDVRVYYTAAPTAAYAALLYHAGESPVPHPEQPHRHERRRHG